MVIDLLMSFGAVGYWAGRQGESAGRLLAGIGALIGISALMTFIALPNMKTITQ